VNPLRLLSITISSSGSCDFFLINFYLKQLGSKNHLDSEFFSLSSKIFLEFTNIGLEIFHAKGYFLSGVEVVSALSNMQISKNNFYPFF